LSRSRHDAYAAIVPARGKVWRRLHPGAVPAAIVTLALSGALWAAWRGGFKDLLVYQYAGQWLLDGRPVYDLRDPVNDLPFTYPPFGAVLAVPLSWLSADLAAAAWTGASMAALAGVVVLVRRSLGQETPAWLVLAVGAGALALEPVWQTLTFGQVNLILMLVVLVDLLHPERRWSGVLVGVACGVKLTPLVFVVLLVLVGRRTTAGRALLTFAATVAVGFVAMPHAATTYWTDGLLDADRVGPPSLAHNQSVYGALTRLLDGTPPTWLWLAVAGPIAVAVALVGAAWWRRGERALGTCLAAVAMLLASPVSWSHHWVWALPIALVLWERSRLGAVAWTAVFVARPILWPPWGNRVEYRWGLLDHVIGNSYLIAALCLVAWASAELARQKTSGKSSAAMSIRSLPVRHTG
jgi:alpha-1,2-mannosyltransferase